MKRKIILTILCLLVILVFSACSFQNNKQNSPITISVLFNNREAMPYNEDWRILEEYQKSKNATLDIRLGKDDDYETAITQHINSDDPPDIILKCWPDTILDYANKGMILPISDYEELMPYYRAYIDKYNLKDEINNLRLENGKYYILPGYKRETQVQQWIYREDIFENNNIEQPKTYDELFDALVILKDKYPDSTPITASWGGAHLFAMIGANYGIPSGWAGNKYYSIEQDKWLFAPATDNYKQMFMFLNKCYSAGLLDPAFLTKAMKISLKKYKMGRLL